MSATNDATCENGAQIKNEAQVGDLDTYVNGFIESDAYGPVVRTATAAALFCDESATPSIVETYDEGCVNHQVALGGCNGSPYPDGSCSSGFVNVGGTCTRSDAFINNCVQFGGYDDAACGCYGSCEDGGSCSPIVVDVLGNGFSLTDAAGGVNFDLGGTGSRTRYSWTLSDSDDAWLALDRDGDGVIDNGRELFGNATTQEPPAVGQQMNGFSALALYDGPGYGGNYDGKIDQSDAIFNRLRLWQDKNHNGISESREMFTLPQLGLYQIDLKYRLSRQTDQYGNQFRFRSKVWGANGADIGRWAWDVFLVAQQ